jgi:hypothetical protein
MADRVEAINAPMEPFDGLVMEGFAGSGGSRSGAAGWIAVGAFPNEIVGSSAIIAIKRPAQPSWLSTAFGSNTPSRTYFPQMY